MTTTDTKLSTPQMAEVLALNPLIKTLHPFMQPLCTQHVMESYMHGFPARVVQAFRSPEEQYALWLKGRDLEKGDPDNEYIVDMGAVVTHLKIGWHNFGLAYDLGLLRTVEAVSPATKTRIVVTFDPKVDLNHDGIVDWKELADLGVELGLTAGYYWVGFQDTDHFERHRGLTLADATRRFKGGLDVATGQPGVWKPSFA